MASAAFLLLGIAALGHTGHRWAELSQSVDDALVAAIAAERALPPTRVARDAASAQRLAALVRSARHLNAPWSTILDELERHAGGEVALLAIDVDAAQGRVRVELEARRLKSQVDFAQRLGTSSTFERVTLGKHEPAERDPSKPVRMSLEARLVDGAHRTTAGGPP